MFQYNKRDKAPFSYHQPNLNTNYDMPANMRNPVEPFTMVDVNSDGKQFSLFNDMVHLESAKTADHDLQYVAALREQFQDKIVTAIPQVSTNIVRWAEAGQAKIEVDTSNDAYASWRAYVLPQVRSEPGRLGEARQFARYNITWDKVEFIMFVVQIGFSAAQYVITDRQDKEDKYGPSAVADLLIVTVGEWQRSQNKVIWVFDSYWRQDASLYRQIERASWDKVILEEQMKRELSSVSNTFFSSKKVYEDLGVPWKRGLLFHGPPGNGKTVSIKALMHELLFERDNDPIPTLYVKNAPQAWMIGIIFNQARMLSPCMLIFEDIESIVNQYSRSYFFNELDGLASNDGILVVGSTNYLDRLDPGLTKRPSRFDRKYLFPLPNEHERFLYCQYWQQKVTKTSKIEFPDTLCMPMAKVTELFSFAFMQECFVATLLIIARENDSDLRAGHKDWADKYEIWRLFKKEAADLRKQIESGDDAMMPQIAQDADSSATPGPSSAPMDYREAMAAQEAARAQIAFNDRKQPEINTGVWSWVGPRGTTIF